MSILLATTIACALGIGALVFALAREEKQAYQRAARDAEKIKARDDLIEYLRDKADDREHREAELEAVLARKNEENQALSAVALEHANLDGIRTFARLPHEQWPATVNGTRP